jgi:two-component system, OmpR family, sensor histidine kinase KdpD
VIRVEGPSRTPSSELVQLRRLATAAGTSLHIVLGEDVAEALVQFASDVAATQLVLGVDPRRALGPYRAGTTRSVVRAAGALDVHLVPVPGWTVPAALGVGAVRCRRVAGCLAGWQRSCYPRSPP